MTTSKNLNSAGKWQKGLFARAMFSCFSTQDINSGAGGMF